MKFTDKAIKALKPTDKIQDIKELGRHGFYIRVFPSGKKSWIFLYRKDGVQRRMTLGTYPSMSLQKAHTAYEQYRDQVVDGGDPAKDKQQALRREKTAPTVADLAVEYMEKWAKPRKKSWGKDQSMLARDVIPTWGKRKAKSIARRDVILLLDTIVDRGSPIMANRVHSLLHKMFSFAVNRDIISANPAADMPKPSKENKRDRVLSDEEIEMHWHGITESGCMDNATRYALLLQLVTAQRPIEVVSMRWDQVTDGIWTIPAHITKNKLAHRVPLPPQATVILTAIKEANDNAEWVFPSPICGHINPASSGRALKRYLNNLDSPIKSGDVEWFYQYDMRRTAASKMTGAGISRLTVAKILNHVESGVTAVYDRHSYDKEKRQALETWGRRLASIIAGINSDNVVNLTR